MNSPNNEDILIDRSEDFQYTFNLTAFLTVLALLAYDEHNKQRLAQILQLLQSQDVQLAEVIKKSGTELTPHLITFLNTRITENRSALKLKRLFNFFKPDKVEEEASAMAFREAKQLVGMVTLSNDPVFKRIIADRQRLLGEIFDELRRLIARGHGIVINPERLQEIIKCLTDRKLLP